MVSSNTEHFDVAIIGGGPGGTTAATLLKKYDPNLKVVILEKEKFPREHIGESQLPAIGAILNEMGCWDKVEGANFPIKVGVTYRWGHSNKLWDFELIRPEVFRDEPRPTKFGGQRYLTAFQVDRAVYDQILLNHAREMGVDVREEVQVTRVETSGDHVNGLVTDKCGTITADHYIDASGHSGILRRAVDVPVDVPTKLMNIAIWDYWENAEWAVKIGIGGTRTQIMSVKNGWLWFIPLGPTRTSLGLVCLAEYYKNSGRKAEDLYLEAIKSEPRIGEWTKNATREGKVRTCKDWSFLADRIVGENWFLVGEAAGFADPILSGGMTLAQSSARDAAYTILAIRARDHEPAWLKTHYNDQNRNRIRQYIRFADFWYSFNGQFTDLEQITTDIAKDAGFKLNAADAFRWLSLGGFNTEDWFLPGIGNLDFVGAKEVMRMIAGEEASGWNINKFTHLKLNLVGAKKEFIPVCNRGKIQKFEAYVRNGKTLPLSGLFGIVLDVMKSEQHRGKIEQAFKVRATMGPKATMGIGPGLFEQQCMATLETMLLDNWITGRVEKGVTIPPYRHLVVEGSANISWNADATIDERRTRSGAKRGAANPPKN